jgi:hypothetical protein
MKRFLFHEEEQEGVAIGGGVWYTKGGRIRQDPEDVSPIFPDTMERSRPDNQLEEVVHCKRKEKATDFLKSVLYRALDGTAPFDEQTVGGELQRYRATHPGLGGDFDIGVVIGCTMDQILDIRSRNQCEVAEKALEVLDRLSKLDLEQIDNRGGGI